MKNFSCSSASSSINGDTISLFKLANSNDMQVEITNIGASIKKILIPNQQNELINVVLGHEETSEYAINPFFIGALCGRFANRIAKGQFTLNQQNYQLSINRKDYHLHGGITGLSHVKWQQKELSSSNDYARLILTYTSVDGAEGYPGNLQIEVIYTLRDDNSLDIEYLAKSDKDTIINLTNHSYFNLSGKKQDILDHQLQVNASKFIELDKDQLATGKILDVQDSPFDFRHTKSIAQDINQQNTQLTIGNGYDICLVLDKELGKYEQIAQLSCSESGITMQVFSDTPALQIYTGNNLSGKFIPRQAICLETGTYTDAPNHANFPSAVLKANELFNSKTTYSFSSK